jgi:hypothetical protein
LGLFIGFNTTGITQHINWPAGQDFEFMQHVSGLTTRMIIKDNGDVGIGTTSPGSILELKGDNPELTLNTTDYLDGINFKYDGSSRWSMAWNSGSGYMYFYNWTGGGTSMVLEDVTGNVGIGTATPNSKLHIGSSYSRQVRTVSSSTTINDTDNVLLVNSNTVYTLYLPDATGREGRIYTVKNIQSGSFNLDGYSSQTIEGSSFILVGASEFLTVICDGSGWWIIG